MDSCAVDVPVFADTNLGTHFAMSVSPDISAGKFKRELESVHSNYFPEIGNIRVHRLMVKRRSCFYHLPESLPIKHVFQCLKGPWFINLEAYPRGSSEHDLPKCVAEEVWDHISDESNAADDDYFTGTKRNDTKWKRKKRKIKRFYCLKYVLQELLRSVNLPKKNKRRKKLAKTCFLNSPVKGLEKKHLDRKENEDVEEWNPCSLVEASSQTLSEPVSVSGIIKKYFSGYDEVTSITEGQFKSRTDEGWSNLPIDIIPQSAEKTPPTMVVTPFPAKASSGPSRDKHKRREVGKCLVMASNNLGMSASKRKPTVSVHQYRERRVSILRSSSLVRSLVFEISDEDE